MDANKFGCFVAERRKELNMTQKNLAAKIQVTDKAVSKWERGLGFPDINTIEILADALDVSIMELMKSERIVEEATVEENVVNEVVQIAKADIEERQKIITYTVAGTSLLLTVFELILSIDWNAEGMSLRATVPWVTIIPAMLMLLYGIVCKIRGKQSFGAIEIGFCLLLIPIIILGGAFLICGFVLS
ncbi:MAG: helix-turn-helix transcriptional regulator [Eubacteriales bacterium]|nr:helix-turn-helix transcriptional regulator [Eubacteriales bacterium]